MTLRTSTLPDSVIRLIKVEIDKALNINQPEITGISDEAAKREENFDKISILKITRKDGEYTKSDIKYIYSYSEGQYRRISHELVEEHKPLLRYHKKKGGLVWNKQVSLV